MQFWLGRDETHAPTDDQLTHDELPDTWLTIYGSSVLAGAPCGVIFPIKGGEPCVECTAPVDRILLRENPAESTPCYDLTGISEYEVLLYNRAMPRQNADGDLQRPVPIGVLQLKPVFTEGAIGAGGRRRMEYAYHEVMPKPGVRWFPRELVASILREEHGDGEAAKDPQLEAYLDASTAFTVEDGELGSDEIKQRVTQYPPCDPRLLQLIEMAMWERRFRVPDAVV